MIHLKKQPLVTLSFGSKYIFINFFYIKAYHNTMYALTLWKVYWVLLE